MLLRAPDPKRNLDVREERLLPRPAKVLLDLEPHLVGRALLERKRLVPRRDPAVRVGDAGGENGRGRLDRWRGRRLELLQRALDVGRGPSDRRVEDVAGYRGPGVGGHDGCGCGCGGGEVGGDRGEAGGGCGHWLGEGGGAATGELHI